MLRRDRFLSPILPAELWGKLICFLNPEDILGNLSLVNCFFYSLSYPEKISAMIDFHHPLPSTLSIADYIWEIKYKLHFPYRYARVKKNMGEVSWKNEFNHETQINKKKFSLYVTATENTTKALQLKRIQKLFSCAKEGDADGLAELTPSSAELSRHKDSVDHDVADWVSCAQFNQEKMSTFCFQIKLQSYQNTMQVDCFNKTSLHWAAHFNAPSSTIDSLLEQGSEINKIADNGMTALRIALMRGYFELVDHLLKKGADVHQSFEGVRPLTMAVENNHLRFTELLISHNANVNDFVSETQDSLLWYASKKNYFQIVQCLLTHGAKINQKNNSGETPLWIAASQGHFHVAEYLIANGADVNQENQDEETPVSVACMKGHAAVARCLLLNGAKLNLNKNAYALPHLNLEISNILNALQGLNKKNDGAWVLEQFLPQDIHYGQLDFDKKINDSIRTMLWFKYHLLNDQVKKNHLVLDALHDLIEQLKQHPNRSFARIVNDWKESTNSRCLKTNFEIIYLNSQLDFRLFANHTEEEKNSVNVLIDQLIEYTTQKNPSSARSVAYNQSG